jgi:ethanolamine utilization protein
MDIEHLITRLTREILKQLQVENGREIIMVLASRAEADGMQLPTEFADSRLIFLDDADRPETICRWIMPRLSLAQLTALAGGRADDPAARLLLATVLAGRQVEVLDYEYTRYQQTAPPALYRLYESQHQKLIEFGIRPFAEAKSEESADAKRLITEGDIRALLASGESRLQLGRNCRITPLAVDYARDNHFIIERERGSSCLSPKSSATSGPLARKNP